MEIWKFSFPREKDGRFIAESCHNVVFFSTREITVVFKGRSRRQLTLSSIKSTRRFSSLCRWFISRYSINGINKTIYNILRFIQRRWRLLLWKCFIDFTRVSLSFSTSITINHHFIFSFFFISPHIYVSVFSSGWRNGARDSLCESFFFVVYYFKIVKEKKKRKEKRVEKEKSLIFWQYHRRSLENSLIPLYNLLH